MSVWFYAILLIAFGTVPFSIQITPSCNRVHLLMNTNTRWSCHFSSWTENLQRCTKTKLFRSALHTGGRTNIQWKVLQEDISGAPSVSATLFRTSKILPPRFLTEAVSQARSCLPLLRHSSLLSGQGSWRTRVIRQQRTCFVTLGGKAWTYLGKCPLIPSYTHLFLSDSLTAWREFPFLPVSKYLKAQSTQSKQMKGTFLYFFLYY